MPDPLHVEPGAGHDAAALCDDAADELAELAAQLDDEPLRELLGRHAENLNEFGVRFRSVDAAYGEADRGGGDRYSS
ncbi:MAG: hypothetical protein ACRDU5_20110 [Mycobacterium sp.]